MEDKALEQLRKMFVGKRVKITYEYGKHITLSDEKTAQCVAIHETPGSTTPFDIELDNGERHGFSVETISSNYCEGKAVQGTRKIEVVE